MEAFRTPNGLFTFGITVRSKYSSKRLTGLVDTGSNICACTYKIPTTLRARPTSWSTIARPAGKPVQSFGYSLRVGFDGRSEMTHVYRLPLDMPEIDFILGMSILSKCNVSISADRMVIDWI